jgi:RNA polymerase sigma-70 factor (ECF subfamily)
MTARFRVVSATEPTAGNRGNGSHSTLGDLLYADQAKARVSEDEWIRMVRAIAAADQSALHALYERTHRLVFTLTMRITRNRATAEELTIDVFHDVWRRASEYDAANGSVIGWIMNQARSRAIDRLRFEQRQKRVKPGKEEDPQYAPAGDGSERVLEARDRSRALRNALALLSADERQAIETAFFFEASYAEVAARLNQPLGTIKTRIRSGLMKLRRTLGATGEAA